METSPITTSEQSAVGELRSMLLTSVVAAALPLPLLVATNVAKSADISCVYLGLATAWLVIEFYRSIGIPDSLNAWRIRMLAIATAVLCNVTLFAAFGIAAGVQTRFPFPLMALLSSIPAIGIMPWMLRRVRNPFASIVLGAGLMLLAKLAACTITAIVYGDEYAGRHVAADWRTAKLMISLYWIFSTLLSVGFLFADYIGCKRGKLSNSL